jgi:hypothetical protein
VILDRGFCTIYEVSNAAEPGNLPEEILAMKYQSWYGELNFETSPAKMAAHEGVMASERIRIIQNRSINNHDVAVLSDQLPPPEDAPRYNIVRAYHGIDEENGQPITDLTLERLT